MLSIFRAESHPSRLLSILILTFGSHLLELCCRVCLFFADHWRRYGVEEAFVLNRHAHWVAIRKIGGVYWDLNSTLDYPCESVVSSSPTFCENPMADACVLPDENPCPLSPPRLLSCGNPPAYYCWFVFVYQGMW